MFTPKPDAGLCMSVDLPLGKKLWKTRDKAAGRRARPSGWRAARGPWAAGSGSAFCKTLQTQQQLDLELPQSLAGESDSELNSECTIHSRLTLN